MNDWPLGGLEDDMRPRMFDLARAGRSFSLATIVAAEGGPLPAGTQMVVTEDTFWGFLSGGCIEADIALHGREVLADGEPRRLVYGRGSPFIDTRLPCGGRLDVLVERVPFDDPAVSNLAELTAARHPAVWASDGYNRRCQRQVVSRETLENAAVPRVFQPFQRLIVVGSDPFALAIAGLGALLGWEATVVAPFGPVAAPPVPVGVVRLPIEQAFSSTPPDAWTAVAVATHDVDLDHDALVAALNSQAGYIGVLGARRRIPERLAMLRTAGISDEALARLRTPIGLNLGAVGAWEVAVSVTAQIVAERRGLDLTIERVRVDDHATEPA